MPAPFPGAFTQKSEGGEGVNRDTGRFCVFSLGGVCSVNKDILLDKRATGG